MSVIMKIVALPVLIVVVTIISVGYICVGWLLFRDGVQFQWRA